MKKPRTFPPIRLGATSETGASAGAYADLSRLLSTTPSPPPLDGFAVSRVERRLRDSLAARAVHGRARWVPAIAVAMALVFGGGLFATGATVVAHRGWSLRRLVSALSWPVPRPTSEARLPATHRGAGVVRPVRSGPAASPAHDPLNEPSDSPARPAPLEPARASTTARLGLTPPIRPIAPMGPPTPTPTPTPTTTTIASASVRPRRPRDGWSERQAVEPSSFGAPPAGGRYNGGIGVEIPRSEEVRLFARAVALLRREDRASSAIALCDEYLRRFPNGALVDEVEAVRAEGELRSGDHGAALAGLGRLALRDDERGIALRLARAELSAETSCAAALGDFDRVLAARSTATVGERALYGRSACRARTGDEAGAQADARAYLQRFPAGPHASLLRDRAGL